MSFFLESSSSFWSYIEYLIICCFADFAFALHTFFAYSVLLHFAGIIRLNKGNAIDKALLPLHTTTVFTCSLKTKSQWTRCKILPEALARMLAMHPYKHELFYLADASEHLRTLGPDSCTALLTCSAVWKCQTKWKGKYIFIILQCNTCVIL